MISSWRKPLPGGPGGCNGKDPRGVGHSNATAIRHTKADGCGPADVPRGLGSRPLPARSSHGAHPLPPHNSLAGPRSGRLRWSAGVGPAAPAPGRPAPEPRARHSRVPGDCIAHHPNSDSEYDIWYAQGCTGHDEPELDPVSSLPGSAQDLTWTAVLPSDGAVPVSSVGPTFWWGGTVTDPNPHALFGQAFLEVQFYPDAIVSNCDSAGGFNVTYAPDKFSVCTPGLAGRGQEPGRDRGVQRRTLRQLELVPGRW